MKAIRLLLAELLCFAVMILFLAPLFFAFLALLLSGMASCVNDMLKALHAVARRMGDGR